MLTILDPLRSLSILSILLRFLMAIICGGVIGIERGRRQHAAGLRTHIVVCIGSVAVMMVGQYLTQYLGATGDISRMGAQVVSGIGFLGAGTIIITGRQQGQRVKGLTTAAGLWASACMGLAIGAGFYEGAIIMCLLLVMVIAALTQLDDAYVKSAAALQVYVEYESFLPFSAILWVLREEGWHVTSIEYIAKDKEHGFAVLLDIYRNDRQESGEKLLNTIRTLEGVKFVEDL